MGAWGFGVFDSDTACDVLGDTLRSLKRVIERDVNEFRDPLRMGHLERGIVAAVAILDAIVETISIAAVHVSREEVDRWESAYLKWFDGSLGPECGEPQSSTMRSDAVRVFDRLRTRIST